MGEFAVRTHVIRKPEIIARNLELIGMKRKNLGKNQARQILSLKATKPVKSSKLSALCNIVRLHSGLNSSKMFSQRNGDEWARI